MKETVEKAALFLLIALVASSIPAAAQVSPTTGAIRGTVTDPSGAIVPNATVVLINTSLAIHRQTKTGADGAYLLPLVPPASGYELDVEAQGFAKAVIQNIVVQVTEVTTTPVQLAVASQSNQVVVKGAARPSTPQIRRRAACSPSK